MHLSTDFKQARKMAYALITFTIFGCSSGNSINGTYKPSGTAHFQSMSFKSGGIAEVTFLGTVSEVTYKIEDKAVKMTGGGQTVILTIDDRGCIVGGPTVGTYCKG